jgi:alpha-L-fucosidase
MFVNGESIYGTRPWVVPNEGEYYFTKKRMEDTLYVHVDTMQRWPYASWRDIVLRSVKLKPGAKIEVLGQSDELVEYQPKVIPKTTWKQTSRGLEIRAMRAQRIYNDRKWPNPVVLKITGAEPAFAPPVLSDATWRWDAASNTAIVEATLTGMGGEGELPVTFEYRSVKGLDLTERAGAFTRLPEIRVKAPGRVQMKVPAWKPGDVMEFRAVGRHPLLEVYSVEERASVP